uniref:KTSC domain-containing protein n=1 Tax=Heterorhabditis bacteriophora TaxID=37862 RepID=A0A1I7WAR8_HETBA
MWVNVDYMMGERHNILPVVSTPAKYIPIEFFVSHAFALKYAAHSTEYWERPRRPWGYVQKYN